MAKVVYFKALGGESPVAQYSGSFEISAAGNGKTATIFDVMTNARIQISGTGLKTNDDGFSAGNIDEFIFKGPEGEKFVSVKGDYKAAALTDAMEDSGFIGLVLEVFKKNDDIVGSSGADSMYGYGGKDTLDGKAGKDFLTGGEGNGDKLTGGADSDRFGLSFGIGKDVVTDFDIKGKDHDIVQAFGVISYDVSEKNGDVVISINDNDSIRLQGISKKQFDAERFVDVVTPDAQPDFMV